MEQKIVLTILMAIIITGCRQQQAEPIEEKIQEPVKTIAELKKELVDKGFQIFDYVDKKTKDTVLMQQYFIAFLKRGPERSQDKAAADSLQALHLAYLGRMYEAGYADISGPFGDDGDIRGITIYNVPTLQMADSLANLDPAVKAGDWLLRFIPGGRQKGSRYDKSIFCENH